VPDLAYNYKVKLKTIEKMGRAALEKCRTLPQTLANQNEEDLEEIVPTR